MVSLATHKIRVAVSFTGVHSRVHLQCYIMRCYMREKLKFAKFEDGGSWALGTRKMRFWIKLARPINGFFFFFCAAAALSERPKEGDAERERERARIRERAARRMRETFYSCARKPSRSRRKLIRDAGITQFFASSKFS